MTGNAACKDNSVGPTELLQPGCCHGCSYTVVVDEHQASVVCRDVFVGGLHELAARRAQAAVEVAFVELFGGSTVE